MSEGAPLHYLAANMCRSDDQLCQVPYHLLQAAIAFKGGETAALQRLKHYVWDTGCISDYFNTRNGMLGADYSTKFSPWLAHGCISPRTIHHEVRDMA